MPAEDYIREKFSASVDALATGTGSIQERLHAAFLSGFFTLRREDFPDEAGRAKFGALMERLTSHAAVDDEGSVTASVKRMNDEQARAVASMIVELDRHYRPLWFFQGRSIVEE